MLPLVNARLTAVTPVGATADFDAPAGAAAPRWTGNVGVYVAEEVLEQITAGRIDQVQRTRIELPWTPGSLVRRGDTLTYTYEGQTQTATAGTIARASVVNRVQVLAEDR